MTFSPQGYKNFMKFKSIPGNIKMLFPVGYTLILNLEIILITKHSFIALKMTNKGPLSQISLTGQDGFDW